MSVSVIVIPDTVAYHVAQRQTPLCHMVLFDYAPKLQPGYPKGN